MTSSALPHRRWASRLRNAAVAVVLVVGIFALINTLTRRESATSSSHIASAPAQVISAHEEADGVHVRARLDAPSPKGTSHELTGVIPTQTWALTKVVWACYPPSDPSRGTLRSPLDPDCSTQAK